MERDKLIEILTKDKKELSTLTSNDSLSKLIFIYNQLVKIEPSELSTATLYKVNKLKRLIDKAMFIMEDLTF